MVNPAFSESQLKNLRRQNRHLASTHRRKLVFLQASRNPAHGSGRPFFVRDVPVPASFCPAFALPAPVSAAPQLRPFCRPHRFCPRLPAAPVHRTKYGSVLCTLPFRIPARHPGNGPARHLSVRPLSLRPSGSRFRSSGRSAVPSASALVFQPLPHAGQSSGPYCACCRSASPPGTPGMVPSRHLSARLLSLQPSPLRLPFPQLHPFCRPHRFCLRLPASPARRTEFGFVLCALPFRFPARHPGNGPARHLSARLLSLQPSPLRLPFPQLPSSGRSAVPSASALVFQPLPHAGQSSDSFCARCRSASPPGTPGTVPSQHLSIRPSPLRLPFPQLPSSDRSAVLTASALVFQPLPHAGQSSGPYCARCRSASPPGTPGTVPSDIFLPGLRPSGSRFRRSAVFALSRRGSAPPRGDRPNRLLLRPGTRKGLSDRSQTAPFLSVCYSGTSPNTQFSENWKNSSDGPLHSYSRSRTSPPPSEHAAQRIEKLAGQLRPLPNRAAGRPPSRPGSGKAQQFIAPQQWIT